MTSIEAPKMIRFHNAVASVRANPDRCAPGIVHSDRFDVSHLHGDVRTTMLRLRRTYRFARQALGVEPVAARFLVTASLNNVLVGVQEWPGEAACYGAPV